MSDRPQDKCASRGHGKDRARIRPVPVDEQTVRCKAHQYCHDKRHHFHLTTSVFFHHNTKSPAEARLFSIYCLLLLAGHMIVKVGDQHDDFGGLGLLGAVSEIGGQLVIHDACGLEVG